jgi:hypothetical protein
VSAPVGRREFFALEAGEYLERLTLLVSTGGPPDIESLVRYGRALRGAALMAGPPGYAMAASALESVAKALRDGGARWSPELAEAFAVALETGKGMLRRVSAWDDTDIASCERTAAALQEAAGISLRRSGAFEATAAPTQSAAVRAFIARETAALAATLDQAAEAVSQGTAGALGAVVSRLQPLRGLGALPGLTPLPELLDALELALGQRDVAGGWPPGIGRAFHAAAVALSHIARDIAELGLTRDDTPELLAAATALREAFASDADVVPIASLFGTQDPEPIPRRRTAPAVPEPPADPALELMGLADRLQHAAAQLRGPAHGAARPLQLLSLAFALRGTSPSPGVSATAGNLLYRLDREIMAGRVASAAEPVAAILERASRAISQAAESAGLGSLAAMLAPLCSELDLLAPEVEGPIVPIESLAPEPEPVPIESLAPAKEPVVPIETLAPSYSAFEQTLSTYHGLLHSPRAAAEPEAVPIQVLLLRGRRALERADLVRQELGAALQARHDLASIELLLGELLDLVPLALADER